MSTPVDDLRAAAALIRETASNAESLADLLDSIATVHEQPPCDAPGACSRCAEPDPVIIDALRVALELTGRTP